MVTALVVGLSACSNAAPEAEQQPYSAPAWMGDVRQQNEEYQKIVSDCFTKHGVDWVLTMGGGVASFVPADPDTGKVDPALEAAVEAAHGECYDAAPIPEYATVPVSAETYRQTLELRECLIEQGFSVPEPPSEEIWLDDAKTGQEWSPYAAIFETDPKANELSAPERNELVRTCPQTQAAGFNLATDDGVGLR